MKLLYGSRIFKRVPRALRRAAWERSVVTPHAIAAGPRADAVDPREIRNYTGCQRNFNSCPCSDVLLAQADYGPLASPGQLQTGVVWIPEQRIHGCRQEKRLIADTKRILRKGFVAPRRRHRTASAMRCLFDPWYKRFSVRGFQHLSDFCRRVFIRRMTSVIAELVAFTAQ